MNILTNIIGIIFICTSILDGAKYHWNAVKIKQVKSARGHSRQFINVSILNNMARIVYGVTICDWYVIISSLFAMYFMLELFVRIYQYYPYKNRKRQGFKRPDVLSYFINSILPNNIAKRL